MLFPKLNFYCLTSMQNITLYFGGTFPEEKKIIIIDPIKPSDYNIRSTRVRVKTLRTVYFNVSFLRLCCSDRRFAS